MVEGGGAKVEQRYDRDRQGPPNKSTGNIGKMSGITVRSSINSSSIEPAQTEPSGEGPKERKEEDRETDAQTKKMGGGMVERGQISCREQQGKPRWQTVAVRGCARRWRKHIRRNEYRQCRQANERSKEGNATQKAAARPSMSSSLYVFSDSPPRGYFLLHNHRQGGRGPYTDTAPNWTALSKQSTARFDILSLLIAFCVCRALLAQQPFQVSCVLSTYLSSPTRYIYDVVS